MNIAVFGRKHYTEKIIKWSVGQGICVKFVVAENSYENKAIIDYAISNNIKILNPTEIYEKPICLDEIDLIVSYLFPYLSALPPGSRLMIDSSVKVSLCSQ